MKIPPTTIPTRTPTDIPLPPPPPAEASCGGSKSAGSRQALLYSKGY